jgi:hypothetical protein
MNVTASIMALLRAMAFQATKQRHIRVPALPGSRFRVTQANHTMITPHDKRPIMLK